MARPTKPKEIKPKSEGAPGEGAPAAGGSGGLSGMKLIAVNTVVTLLICVLFIGSNYFVVQNTLTTALKNVGGEAAHEEGAEEGAEEGGDEVQRGIIFDLGEFILNLSDPKSGKYLKVEVAIELSRKETDPDPHAPAAGGGHGGHGDSGGDPFKAVKEELENFKPAIRDAIISTLSSKTAEELSSVAGKENAKEQIKEAVDGILAGERETLRVSFGTFIIQ